MIPERYYLCHSERLYQGQESTEIKSPGKVPARVHMTKRLTKGSAVRGVTRMNASLIQSPISL